MPILNPRTPTNLIYGCYCFLLYQVSKLEKNIQNTKSRQVDDLSRGERKLQQALEDLQLKNKEIVTLKDALRLV